MVARMEGSMEETTLWRGNSRTGVKTMVATFSS